MNANIYSINSKCSQLVSLITQFTINWERIRHSRITWLWVPLGVGAGLRSWFSIEMETGTSSYCSMESQDKSQTLQCRVEKSLVIYVDVMVSINADQCSDLHRFRPKQSEATGPFLLLDVTMAWEGDADFVGVMSHINVWDRMDWENSL
ncbi:unnamed protein product [Litomosoides sigmodontis]|uniref:Uncharacterized protein n=1 Tax=Litomosoides sigmodontis TaxID=42156 RepID=A0A3P6TT78_LITSI|nr:unnamed protein product [Litomosoides sigmodontis]